MADLDGKTALVTGGTSGIGLAVVRRFVTEGAHVVVTGRSAGKLDDVKRELGDRVTTVQGDVSSLDDLDRVYAAVAERGTGLDVVFANAGGGEFAALEEITWEHFTTTFESNVGGTVFTVQKALPHLNPGAAVVLTSSNIDVKGSASFSVYAASKAAIRSFARSWAAELVDRGIRVNAVAPGPIATPGLSGLAAEPEQAEALLGGLASGVPMRRLGTPEEIADAVLYLASPRSSYVTGAELYVDGGASQI
ncbi:oxidoreductase [Cnuibacter physcomitrellae]|uniref:Short-chain dehydrogenase n=1 Tax=Cnuibacter physcomitrellae TaxID=1619308 RepID=A0A1X9LK80_9MICO|nr:SDR family oxidoreductase [Cnuibacter physcomitrellae]ARJ04331.1 short-chain dehydrogenase [Cnuibacter physcomitrellae]GGI40782.1 oxidoreductase [Cnuibacter physcomitrellae]